VGKRGKRGRERKEGRGTCSMGFRGMDAPGHHPASAIYSIFILVLLPSSPVL